MDNRVLNSWKEIAAYTGRGIRTLQRWEREQGFPVRRPRGKHRSAVVGIKEDIDRWMRSPHNAEASNDRRHINSENKTRLLRNCDVLQTRASILLSRSAALRDRVARAIELGKSLRTSSDSAHPDKKNQMAEVATNSQLRKTVAAATQLGVALQNSSPPAKRLGT